MILSDMTFSSSASTAIQKFRREDLGNYAIKSADTSWCRAIIRKDSNQIVVSVKENTSYDQRKAVITLTDLIDTTMTRTFNVTQEQMDAIELDKEYTYFDVKTSGGQVTVKLKTNVDFSVNIDENNDDWISQKTSASTRGLQDSSIVLNVAKNWSGDERIGYVYIVSKKNSDDKVTITIDQQFEASLSVDTTKLSIDELGGTVKVTVTANISYDVYSQSDWITKSSSKETSDSTTTESFKVEEFTEKKKSRTGYVIIENAAYDDMQQKIKITQTRALYIDDTDDISVDVDKTVKLTLTNNTGDDNVTWTSSNKKIATVSSDGTVTGVAAGTATITVTSSDEEHTYSVSVVVNEVEEEETSDESSDDSSGDSSSDSSSE